MATRQRKPYTPSSRSQSYIDYREALTTSQPYKPLLEAKPKKAGPIRIPQLTAVL